MTVLPASTGSSEPVPLADHDEIGRKVVGLPWAIQSTVVTIASHCTAIKDKSPPGDVADLAGCISQDLLELVNMLASCWRSSGPRGGGWAGSMSDADEGWRVVSVVPTLEMQKAGYEVAKTAYANAVAALTGKVAE